MVFKLLKKRKNHKHTYFLKIRKHSLSSLSLSYSIRIDRWNYKRIWTYETLRFPLSLVWWFVSFAPTHYDAFHHAYEVSSWTRWRISSRSNNIESGRTENTKKDIKRIVSISENKTNSHKNLSDKDLFFNSNFWAEHKKIRFCQ